MGQDPLLCILPPDWRVSSTDGSLWSEPKPGNPLEGLTVPCWFVVLLCAARVLTSLAEELPVRLAHRVKELDELPHNLSEMHSIKKVKNWYAQSFEVCFSFIVFRSHRSRTHRRS